MARAIWTGAINFGLVTIPVGLYSATEDHTIQFHQFERGTSDRIRYRRVNERTGEEVDYADIVKGHDVGGGDYVVVEPEELDQIAPGRSRSIDIDTFVDLDEIDPIYFQKTYWLAPAQDQYARSYRLLAAAMAKTNRAGIATFVMRGKQHLTAIRADQGVLALETLFFADEIRDPVAQLPNLPESQTERGKELDMATSLIDSMSGPWRPEDYRDTYTERVEQLIDDKRAGREVVRETEPPEPTTVQDLLEALQRSVEGARAGQASGSGGRSGGRQSARSAEAEPDLTTLRKADLERLARERGVKGRSRMSRAELERAVADAAPSEAS